MDSPGTNLPAEPEKKKRGPYSISPKLAATLTLFATGKFKTQIDVCQETGMSTKALQQALRKPHVQKWMVENIMTTFALSATRAATKMRELLDSDNGMVSFRAAAYSLAVGAGVAPADTRGPLVAVNIGVSPGFVIDLRDKDEIEHDERGNVLPFPMKDVTPVDEG